MSIFIESLGGSGENGRNCFLLRAGNTTLMLDCGVKRERTEKGIGVYPLLTRKLARQVDAVFISHSHEDHTAALPYLNALGYNGPVFASPETLAALPGMLQKWSRYVTDNGGTLPYAPENIKGLRLVPLVQGGGELAGLPVQTGRSGHMAGGLWLNLHAEGKTVFYSGDMTNDSLLLAMDMPPICDVAVMDCAYADEILRAAQQRERLLTRAREIAQGGGKALLPLPAKGRASELYIEFARRLTEVPLFVEGAIQDGCRALLSMPGWLRTDAPREELSADLHIVRTMEDRTAAQTYPGGAVYLVTDGMLSTAEGLSYMNVFLKDDKSIVLLTGHAARGTAAAELMMPEGRERLGARLSAECITIKVHPDGQDMLSLCERMHPKQVLLFHAERERCGGLIARLATQGVKACCALPPEGLHIL